MLSPLVSIRREPFGALVYHFGNRKLNFLKRPVLVQVIDSLSEYPNVLSAFDGAGVPEEQRGVYLAVLSNLAGADIIQRSVSGVTGVEP
ncbi:mycofactocin biosynthesis chaperone MftB [Burkholderia sp. Ax-1719]|nr:mycofactocin biosynthesis chaperone MftB [Burkholderia sp. Ax-1719]